MLCLLRRRTQSPNSWPLQRPPNQEPMSRKELASPIQALWVDLSVFWNATNSSALHALFRMANQNKVIVKEDRISTNNVCKLRKLM